jgi:O-antigen ligase
VAARLPVAPRALVVAAAIPLLFLHVSYQPGVAVDSVNAYLSDFAVLAVVVLAVIEGVRTRVAPLRPARWLWLALACFLVWMCVEVGLGHRHAASYATHDHAVTAAKFAEYALLAPSVALLLRTRAELLLAAWTLAVWSAFATAVGIAQFFGASIFLAGTVGRRQASFLASADFAALSAGALLVGIVVARPGTLRVLALAAGVLGMIVAGAMASVLGLATALVALAVVWRRSPRRLAVAAAAGVVVAVGAIAIRGSDLDAFARFLGATPGAQAHATTKVQTYAHRTLLVWLGWEIWKDHPLLGVGWEGSAEPANFGPYLPAAHRRFPDESPLAFPSPAPDRRYGVQNSWVQALADLGVPGLVLWAATFVAAAWRAGRAALAGSRVGLYALMLVCVLVWLWSAQGYVAGIPLDALTWLGVGLAARA